MSNTFKTAPSWVKLNRQTSLRVESHDHRHGDCDLQAPTKSSWQRRYRDTACLYDVNYYGYHGGFYPRGPARWLKGMLKEYNGSTRCTWRKDSVMMRKLDRHDLEDYDVVNPRARNSCLWDAF